jgi:hypothetical protein
MQPIPDAPAPALTPLRGKPTRAETARANGARSRGPFTDVGKARSRTNALKHGFRSAEFGLLADEDADAWEAHLAAVRATYLPQDPVEVHLVEGIAVAQWRELRTDRVEADVMCDIRPAFAGRSHGTNFVARDDARAGTGTALRYRTQAQLEVQRAVGLLRRHRQDRLAGLIPPFVDEPCTPEPEPLPREEPEQFPANDDCMNEPSTGKIEPRQPVGAEAVEPPDRPAASVGDEHRQGARLPDPLGDLLGRGRAARDALLLVVAAQAPVQVRRVLAGEIRHVAHGQILEHHAEHGPDAVDPRQVGPLHQLEQPLGGEAGLPPESGPVPGLGGDAQELAAGRHAPGLEREPGLRGQAPQLADREGQGPVLSGRPGRVRLLVRGVRHVLPTHSNNGRCRRRVLRGKDSEAGKPGRCQLEITDCRALSPLKRKDFSASNAEVVIIGRLQR